MIVVLMLCISSFPDGFPRFRASFPEWCDSCIELLDNSSGNVPPGQDPLPLMGLKSLRISAPPLHRPHRSCDSLSSTANSSTDSSDTDDRCDSSLGSLRGRKLAAFNTQVYQLWENLKIVQLSVHNLTQTDSCDE